MNLGKTIQTLRKLKNLTQNELAEKLFVSYQAVSQWENCNTNPDISILPNIADVFGITIDELFGRSKPQVSTIDENIIFGDFDKNTLYILVVEGNKLQKSLDYKKTIDNYKDINIELKGDVKNIYSHFSVQVEGECDGSIHAGDGVNCGNVGGSVTAGDGVNCGNVTGSVSAGDGVNCGNVSDSVTAGDSVNCGNVTGSVSAGDSINCGDIYGNVEAEEIKCKTIKCQNIRAEKIYIETR